MPCSLSHDSLSALIVGVMRILGPNKTGSRATEIWETMIYGVSNMTQTLIQTDKTETIHFSCFFTPEGEFSDYSKKGHKYLYRLWHCRASDVDFIPLTMIHSLGRNFFILVQSFIRSQSKILYTHRKWGVSTASESSVVTVTVMTQGQTPDRKSLEGCWMNGISLRGWREWQK